MAKVKWDFCCAPKIEGGLGIIDIKEMADRLAAKWILRGMLNPNLDWAWFLDRKNHLFSHPRIPQMDGITLLHYLC